MFTDNDYCYAIDKVGRGPFVPIIYDIIIEEYVLEEKKVLEREKIKSKLYKKTYETYIKNTCLKNEDLFDYAFSYGLNCFIIGGYLEEISDDNKKYVITQSFSTILKNILKKENENYEEKKLHAILTYSQYNYSQYNYVINEQKDRQFYNKTEIEQEILTTIQNINPYAFENFSKILLEKNGFTNVSVTKHSGDGGIDGFGKIKLNEMISLTIAFQCKRYSNSNPVPVSAIRDFRGSLTADIDKGLFITTSIFSKGAIEEALIQGKQRIDLVDGKSIVDQIIKYQIGINTEKMYSINKEYLNNLNE